MRTELVFLLAILAAYLIGGIPFGYLIGRFRGVDVRTVGSKNIGATNVFRTVGKAWGLLAFTLDVLKGLVPVLVAKSLIVHYPPPPLFSTSFPLAVGITCVLGHMLTPYMCFRGGKGVATALGMLIGLVPGLAGTAFAFFALVFAASHYISLGSCCAAAFLAVGVWFPWLGMRGIGDLPQCILVTLLALFVIWKHRTNIVRLVHGNENKIYLFGKGNNQHD